MHKAKPLLFQAGPSANSRASRSTPRAVISHYEVAMIGAGRR